jgi:hypothetical protein
MSVLARSAPIAEPKIRTSVPLRVLPGGAPAINRGERPAAPAAGKSAAPARRVMPLRAYVVLLTGVLLTSMVATLFINVVLAQGAFELQEVQRQSRILQERQEELTQKVVASESPAFIERRARKLGMVPAASAVFLRLADNSVIGEPVAAARPPRMAAASR